MSENIQPFFDWWYGRNEDAGAPPREVRAAWRACEKQASKDAAIGRLIRRRLVSGNGIPISRAYVTVQEVHDIDTWEEGECSSLLNGDSGGDAVLDTEISAALAQENDKQ